MKTKYFLLALLLLTASTIDPELNSKFDSSEEPQGVTYLDSKAIDSYYIIKKLQDPLIEQDIIITQTILGVASPTFYYIKTADYLNNVATHRFIIPSSEPLEITLTSPSNNGGSKTPEFVINVTTNVQASCEYSLPTSAYNNVFFNMQSYDNGITHTIDLGLRLRKGEQIPLQVKCQAGDQTTLKQFLIGYDDHTSPITARVIPGVVSVQGEPVTIELTSEQPVSCALKKEDSTIITDFITGKELVFEGISSFEELYYAVCKDYYGNNLPEIEVAIPENLYPSEITVQQTNPKYTNEQPVVQSVYTNVPASCKSSIGDDPRLGPLSNKRLHQRAWDLEEGSYNPTITCSDLAGRSGQAQLELVVDRTPPSASHAVTPYICDDQVVVTVRSDEVALLNFNLNGKTITRPLPVVNKDYIIRLPFNANEDDTVGLIGVDKAGNTGVESTAVISNARKPDNCEIIGEEQQLTLLNPVDGVTNADTFDLVIGSEWSSTCKWVYDGKEETFTNTGDTQHVEINFPSKSGLLRHQENIITIKCTDVENQLTEQDFVIAWDLTNPTITLSAEPNPVVDFNNPISIITVSSDQEVKCRYDGGELTPDYKLEHQFPIVIPRRTGSRTVFVQCYNRASLEGNNSITIIEDYPSEMMIFVNSPLITNNKNYLLNISTNMPATCQATLSETKTLDRNLNTHTKSFTLSEGNNNFDIACTELNGDKYKQLGLEVMLDSQGPVINLTNPAYTCGLDEYTVTGTVVDDNLDEIIINFTGYQWVTKSLPITLKNLDLEVGKEYQLKVWATDKAGNSGGPASVTVTAQEAITAACDTENPKGFIIQKPLNNKTLVSVYCEDDKGCSDEYEVSVGAVDGACNYNKYNFSVNRTHEVTTKSKFCYKVYDLAGNFFEEQQEVDIISVPPHCFNNISDADETGVDCGGSCQSCQTTCDSDADCQAGFCSEGVCVEHTCFNGVKDPDESDVDCGWKPPCEPCDTGKTCSISQDCASNNCKAGVCQAPSCDDNKKNGDETGVDCGGSCPNKCEDDAGCVVETDCLSGFCQGGICTPTGYKDNRTSKGSVCGDGVCGDFELCDLDCAREEEPSCDVSGDCKESNLLGWIFIIIGALLLLAGGGMLGYEKYEEQHAPPKTTDYSSGFSSTVSSSDSEQETPSIDFSESAIEEDVEREKLREQKQESRVRKRKQLLKEFDD